MTKKQPTIYAFIDSQNLNLGVLEGHKWKLDFARFRIYLADKLHVSKAFLFIGNVPGNEGLYTFLRKVDYQVILKPTLVYKKEKKIQTKGNVDAELVLHSMIEFPNYDKAVFVTGDGDFHCLLEYLENKSKLDFLIIPNKYQYSALLRRFLKHMVYIGELRSRLEQKKERH